MRTSFSGARRSRSHAHASALRQRLRLAAPSPTPSAFVPDSLDLSDPDIPPGALDGAIVTGLSADGLHRTATELARKDAVGETLFGGGAEYRVTTSTLEGRLGVVGYNAQFDSPLAAGERPDDRFDFAGDQATMVSVYADAKTRAGQAFSEVARAPGGAVGGLGGASGGPGRRSGPARRRPPLPARLRLASTATPSASATG